MANEKTIAAKAQAVEELSEKLKGACSVVIVDYTGVTVEDDTAMRKALREANVDYTVIKNKMTKRALDNLGYTEFDDVLHGMTAVAVSKDEVSAAKVLKDYADKVDSLKIKAGICDGKFLDAAGIEKLASIPSKETLIAKMLGSLKGPLYKLANVLDSVAKKDGEAEQAPVAAAE